jgi:hypothetical protein
MSSTSDHVHKGHDRTPPAQPRWGSKRGSHAPLQRRRPPVKRANVDLSVKHELDTAPTRGRMQPSIAQSRTPEGLGRWGIRGMEDFTVEELAQLQQKLDGWIGQRAPPTERTRRRAWVLKSHEARPS